MKRINDTYGHAAGDAYLRRMAHLLMREEPVRRGLSFRIGGDEFVTLFEGEEEETLLRELEVFHMAGHRPKSMGSPSLSPMGSPRMIPPSIRVVCTIP